MGIESVATPLVSTGGGGAAANTIPFAGPALGAGQAVYKGFGAGRNTANSFVSSLQKPFEDKIRMLSERIKAGDTAAWDELQSAWDQFQKDTNAFGSQFDSYGPLYAGVKQNLKTVTQQALGKLAPIMQNVFSSKPQNLQDITNKQGGNDGIDVPDLSGINLPKIPQSALDIIKIFGGAVPSILNRLPGSKTVDSPTGTSTKTADKSLMDQLLPYIMLGTNVGTSLYSGITQSGAIKDAAQLQSDAAKHAADAQAQTAKDILAFQQQQYTQNRNDMLPWLNTGKTALGTLSNLLGLPSGEGMAAGGPAYPYSARANPGSLRPRMIPMQQAMPGMR